MKIQNFSGLPMLLLARFGAVHGIEQRRKSMNQINLGIIDIGDIYRGKRWDDPDIKISWLEYVVSDDCLTSESNKEKARIMLQQRRYHEDQMGLGFPEES
jgi:hypothetical protein